MFQFDGRAIQGYVSVIFVFKSPNLELHACSDENTRLSYTCSSIPCFSRKSKSAYVNEWMIKALWAGKLCVYVKVFVHLQNCLIFVCVIFFILLNVSSKVKGQIQFSHILHIIERLGEHLCNILQGGPRNPNGCRVHYQAEMVFPMTQKNYQLKGTYRGKCSRQWWGRLFLNKLEKSRVLRWVKTANTKLDLLC